MDFVYRSINHEIIINTLNRLYDNGYTIDNRKKIKYDANESSQIIITRLSKNGESFNALIKIRDTEESVNNSTDDICSIGEMNRIIPGKSPEVIAVDFSNPPRYHTSYTLDDTTITILKIPDNSMVLREYLNRLFDKSINPENTKTLGVIVRNGINLIKTMESVNSNSIRSENVLINPLDLSLSIWNFDLSCCVKNYDKNETIEAGSRCCYDKSNPHELNACLMKHDKIAKGVTSPLYIWGHLHDKIYNSFEDGKKNDLFAFLAILHYWAFKKYPFIDNIASFPHFYDIDPFTDFWTINESISPAELATDSIKKMPTNSNFIEWCLNKFKMNNSSERIIFQQQMIIQRSILIFINNMFESFDKIVDLVEHEIDSFIEMSGEYTRIYDLNNLNELENRMSFLLKSPFKLIDSDDILSGSQGLTRVALLNEKEIIAKIYSPMSTELRFATNEKTILVKLNKYEKKNKIIIGPVIYNSIKLKTMSGIYSVNLMQKIKPSFIELGKLIKASRITDTIIKELILELLHKIKHLHNARIYHKDLKEDNILVDINKSYGHRIIIIDFALSCCMNTDSEDAELIRSCIRNVSSLKFNLSPLNMLHELENEMNDFKLEDLGKHNDIATLLSTFYFIINYEQDSNVNYSDYFAFGLLVYPLLFANMDENIFTNSLFTQLKKDPSNADVDIQIRFKQRFERYYIKSNKDNELKRDLLDNMIDNMFEYYYNNLYEDPDVIIETLIEMVR